MLIGGVWYVIKGLNAMSMLMKDWLDYDLPHISTRHTSTSPPCCSSIMVSYHSVYISFMVVSVL